MGRVVWWRAVVGGGRDHQAPFLRQLVHVVVEGCDGGRKAVGPAVVCDLVRDLLGRTQVGSEEDQERGAAPHYHRRLGFLLLDDRLRRGWLWRRRALGARADLDAEVGRLDREGLLELELVVRVVHELEALQDHPEYERRLQHGELASDAGPLPGTEGLVG